MRQKIPIKNVTTSAMCFTLYYMESYFGGITCAIINLKHQLLFVMHNFPEYGF